MKSLVTALVASMVLALGSAATAQAEQRQTLVPNQQVGQVSDQMLAQLGLGGMQRLSDEQGMEIRGMSKKKAGGIFALNFSKITQNQVGVFSKQKQTAVVVQTINIRTK